MTTEASLKIVESWEELFNTDVERLVTELYSPECRFNGAKMSHDKLIKFEQRVLGAAPQRTIRVDQAHPIDAGVAVEGALLDPDQGADWNLPFCAVLTIADGLIISDNTYTDFSRWPGVS
jgi:hypothetical protein